MIPRRRAGAALAGLLVAALAPAALVLAYLPLAPGLWLGRRLGDLAWAALRRRRRICLANLRRAFGPDLVPAELGRLGRRSFQHLGMNAVELCRLFFRPPAGVLARVDLAGHEHLEAALRGGRGVLIVSAHYGNWELLPARIVQSGHPGAVVVRPLPHPILEAVASRMRRRGGFDLIDKRHGLRAILSTLRAGAVVGLLLDQNASRHEGVFVPFFGEPASTSKGLALIARRSGAAVVPAFIRRTGTGTHRVEVEPALPPVEDVAALTAMVNAAIERAIRRAPEQWLWVHRRWRTRPRLSAS